MSCHVTRTGEEHRTASKEVQFNPGGVSSALTGFVQQLEELLDLGMQDELPVVDRQTRRIKCFRAAEGKIADNSRRSLVPPHPLP